MSGRRFWSYQVGWLGFAQEPPLSRSGSAKYWKTGAPQRQFTLVAPGGLLRPTGTPWSVPHAGQVLKISATAIPRADRRYQEKVACAAPVAEQ
jgi:hypothetical protein